MDTTRAVEILIRPTAPSATAGYGSGYHLGGGLVLTCAHIIPNGAHRSSVRTAARTEIPTRLVWCNRLHDVALLRLDGQLESPGPAVALAEFVPTSAMGSVSFEMYGWPRSGESLDENDLTVRDPVLVNGEIKIAEFLAAPSGMFRLRALEQYEPLEAGSLWAGMSGAAVFVTDRLVGIQVRQPNRQITSYLAARPLTVDVLSYRDEAASISGREILDAAGIRYGIPTTGPAQSHESRAVRPYSLLETAGVVGRSDAKAQVDSFLRSASDDGLMLLIGVPGIGKSAIAWDVWKGLRPAQFSRRFWYSFYDGRGVRNFDSMLSELADFVHLDPAASVDRVLDAIRERDSVLFLDGIERCLRCYQRPLSVGDLEAVRVQESYQWSSHDLSFASEEAARFFLQLAQISSCKTVCTSRVMPAECYASGGKVRAGITANFIGGLKIEETWALLNEVGLDVSQPLAVLITKALDGHPLALQQLARQARRSVAARRNLSSWLIHEGYSLTAGSGPREIRNLLFARSISVLSLESRMALAVVGALGGSLDLPSLYEILPGDLTEDRFFAMVAEVTAAGFAVETPDGELACHAVIAAVSLDHIQKDQIETLVKEISKSLHYTAIRQANSVSSYYDWAVRGDVSDRAEVMALCRALTRLGRYLEAADLYMSDLDMPIRMVLGANFETVDLLGALTTGLAESDSPEHRPRLSEVRLRYAYHLLMSGQVERSRVELLALEVSELSEYDAGLFVEIKMFIYDLDECLRSASALLHRRREGLFYLNGYNDEENDFNPFANVLGKWFERSNGIAAEFLETLVSLVRLLLVGQRTGEASRILLSGFQTWRNIHDHCDGCLGLIIRSAAEIFVDRDVELAKIAQRVGARLQRENGKAFQGLASDVLVLAGLARSGKAVEAAVELRSLLEENGFILYQLVVQSATSEFANTSNRAIAELEEIGASFLSSYATGT